MFNTFIVTIKIFNHMYTIQVAIPSLHVSLGVFQKFFTLYESKCQEMDCKLALSMTDVQNSSKAYQNFVARSAELQSKKDSVTTKREQIRCYEDIITWLALIKDDTHVLDKNESESIIDFLQKEASEMRNEVTILVI